MRKKISVAILTGALIAITGVLSVIETPDASKKAMATETTTISEANIPSEEYSLPIAGVTTILNDCIADSKVCIEANERDIVAAAYVEAEPLIVLEGSDYSRVETDNKKELKKLIKECEKRINAAEQLIESCDTLEYDEEHPIRPLAEQELTAAKADKKFYQNKLDKILETEEKARIEQEKKEAEEAARKAREEKRSKYPIATQVWDFLKDHGYSDAAAAGIIGNMMAECGGQTLALQPDCHSGSHSGLCQWSSRYYSVPSSVSGQLDLLESSIYSEFNTFGKLYSSGFTSDDYKKMSDEQSAAYAFMKVYERCGPGSKNVRMKNASIALDYFTK